jgi:hypothetical protein
VVEHKFTFDIGLGETAVIFQTKGLESSQFDFLFHLLTPTLPLLEMPPHTVDFTTPKHNLQEVHLAIVLDCITPFMKACIYHRNRASFVNQELRTWQFQILCWFCCVLHCRDQCAEHVVHLDLLAVSLKKEKVLFDCKKLSFLDKKPKLAGSCQKLAPYQKYCIF